MIFLKRCILILFFLFISCSDEEAEYLYDFPSLSQGQLIDLKKISETIEGFFITTDLSDVDNSWAERGFYLYACIRFLNDETVNKKLNKSAIPLLIQVSTHKDKPEAESVLLLHPKTVKSDAGGVFYYEEKQHFQFVDSPITIRGIEYNIFDVEFNQKGKITHISFIKKGTSLDDLQAVREEGEDENDEEDDEDERNTDNENDDNNGDDDDTDDDNEDNDNDDEKEESKKDLLLEVQAFAKQFSSSCANWPILKYKHSDGLPDYLQVRYSGEEGTGGQGSSTGSKPTQVPKEIQTPIPENAPHTPVPQKN